VAETATCHDASPVRSRHDSEADGSHAHVGGRAGGPGERDVVEVESLDFWR
jgi:hypothetical protein